MHEYEFRLVAESESPFLPLLESLGLPVMQETVYYVKPHFRFRNRTFETKRVVSTHAVYHDGLWFRWVHSVETPFSRWSRSTYQTFLHRVGNFQDPFSLEVRAVVALDDRAKLYSFRDASRSRHRAVFEYEHGAFPKAIAQLRDPDFTTRELSKYSHVYGLLRPFPSPNPRSNEQLTRKPVKCLESPPPLGQSHLLYARKLDGTFGHVYGYRDRVKEKWEGYECVVKRDVRLGNGLVFAAERVALGENEYAVCLLDVYRVGGHDTAPWNRRAVLTEFLPGLSLPKNYRVQSYATDPSSLPPTDLPTDGLIVHDVLEDAVYKWKAEHTVDLVYHAGHFCLPDGRIRFSGRGLEDGSVYEISTRDGRVIRKRTDRFKGNTAEQLERILKHGWGGPSIEPLPDNKKKTKRRTTPADKVFEMWLKTSGATGESRKTRRKRCGQSKKKK